MSKKNNPIAVLLSEELDISSEFNESSKNVSLEAMPAVIPEQWIKVNYKTYPRLRSFKLKKRKIKSSTFAQLVKKRRSTRNYTTEQISLSDVGCILINSASENELGQRPYPSAGARYPLEIYITALHVDGISKGLYHYNVRTNSLELLVSGDMKDQILKISGNEEWLVSASAVIFICGILDRTKVKYGLRGYRYVLIEAGHLSQNILLSAQDIGLNTCQMGGFIDNEVEKLLDIGISSETPLCMIALGKGR